MKNLITIIIAVTFATYCHAQKISHENLKIRSRGNALFIALLADGSEIKTRDLVISMNEIVVKGSSLVAGDKIPLYTDDKTITTVFIYKILPDVHLMTLTQIFNKYHIDETYRSYKILEDDCEIIEKDNVWLSEGIIDEIIVYPNQQYLNIRTKMYQSGRKYEKDVEAQRLKNIEFYKKNHSNNQ